MAFRDGSTIIIILVLFLNYYLQEERYEFKSMQSVFFVLVFRRSSPNYSVDWVLVFRPAVAVVISRSLMMLLTTLMKVLMTRSV